LLIIVFQAARDALIIDVRYNSGGFISSDLADKLSRKPLGFVKGRWSIPEPYPHTSTFGPKVVLINEGCSSDCDIFAATFCSRLRYPVPCVYTNKDIDASCRLIGERTWGGVVGINWKGDMIDNSRTSQPEFAHWFMDGKGWDVENFGVEPEDVVPFTPNEFKAMYADKKYEDPQMKAAMKYISNVLENSEYKDRMKTCIPDLGLGEKAGESVPSSYHSSQRTAGSFQPPFRSKHGNGNDDDDDDVTGSDDTDFDFFDSSRQDNVDGDDSSDTELSSRRIQLNPARSSQKSAKNQSPPQHLQDNTNGSTTATADGIDLA
jgi:hypothetical protein